MVTRRQFARIALAGGASLALRPADALALLQSGQAPAGAARKVLILGAGAAGLAAGLKLVETRHDVTILEARSRAGGRIHTLREPFSDGLHAEAGAGRIPDTHTLTLEYVKRFGLTLEPFRPQGGAEVFLWRGVRQVPPAGSDPDLARLTVNLTPRERKAGFGGLHALYLGPVLHELHARPAEEWPNPGFERYKNVSLGEYLRQQGASGDAIAYLSQGFEGDSLLDFAHDALSHEPSKTKIRGGNDLLPRAMAARLSQQIHYGAVVRGMEQNDRGVRVVFSAGGQQQVATAERVICTIPLPVLRDIDVSPAWSARKQATIRNLGLSPVTRVFVQTRTRFWERQGLNGFATVDQPMEIWCPTHNEPGTRGILMTYTYERLALEDGALSEQARIERTLDLFERVHPGVRAEFEAATTWSWQAEPFSRGAYTITTAGQFGLVEDAPRAEGRIHFAGEHASPWPGWIQGALHSGLRAANEVASAG